MIIFILCSLVVFVSFSLSATSGLKVNFKNHPWKAGIMAIVATTFSNLEPSMITPAPVHAATLYSALKADDVPGVAGNGGIDAFSAASQAMKVEKQSALKDTDFQKVQRGEMKPSEEPRALKRRVLKACSDGKITKEAKVSTRECTQRVMTGELDFMLSVMKE